MEHLFDLSGSEKVWAFFTPLIIFAAFFVAQLILPARKVTGYVKNPQTGEPRPYRLNGLLVFVIAQILWATEVTGLDRDWFYRSTLWAVLGGTVFTTLFAIASVLSQPKGEIQNIWWALWEGRAKEFQFFGERVDIKMWFYVVGGTMLSLNALSGAVWHSENAVVTNPGVYMYAAFMTFYVFDYFVFERVQLYTYDLIHEHLGFKLW
ncbi:MAG: ergosterol biosynthesis protein, partial [bacterium]|nr:ergosterol biosynthesis protein [bacterium]